MSNRASLPSHASARARADVSWLFLRALCQALLLPARLVREAVLVGRRRRAMAQLLKATAALPPPAPRDRP